jgi:hypothetical protein
MRLQGEMSRPVAKKTLRLGWAAARNKLKLPALLQSVCVHLWRCKAYEVEHPMVTASFAILWYKRQVISESSSKIID